MPERDGWVDLRSDTVTRPTTAMRRAMADAEVGDDGYGEDPTVARLEETFAERLGKNAAVFVPSGTMGNQIALRVLGRPGTLVVAGRRQHLVVYEQAAAATNGVAQLHPVDDPGGVPDLDQVASVVAATAHHQPPVSAVCAENTHMPAGGVPWGPEPLDELASLGAPVHLDGARLFHAQVALGVPVAELAGAATTVMCCLSKGLAAPVGSLLAGPADVIAAARDERKRLGGALRQAGVLAAPGLIALTQMVERLADDHARARRLAEAVAERWPGAVEPADVRTNLVIFTPPDPAKLVKHLAAAGIGAGTIAPGVVRLATHLDVDDAGVARAVDAIGTCPG